MANEYNVVFSKLPSTSSICSYSTCCRMLCAPPLALSAHRALMFIRRHGGVALDKASNIANVTGVIPRSIVLPKCVMFFRIAGLPRVNLMLGVCVPQHNVSNSKTIYYSTLLFSSFRVLQMPVSSLFFFMSRIFRRCMLPYCTFGHTAAGI